MLGMCLLKRVKAEMSSKVRMGGKVLSIRTTPICTLSLKGRARSQYALTMTSRLTTTTRVHRKSDYWERELILVKFL